MCRCVLVAAGQLLLQLAQPRLPFVHCMMEVVRLLLMLLGSVDPSDVRYVGSCLL